MSKQENQRMLEEKDLEQEKSGQLDLAAINHLSTILRRFQR